jgi:hypothetical protein
LGAYGFDYFINNADSEKTKKFIKYFIILILSFVLLWILYISGLFENLVAVYKYGLIYKGENIAEPFYKNSIIQLTKTIIILLVLLGLIILYKKKIIVQQVILLLFILLSFADLYIFGSEQNNGDIPSEKYFINQKIVPQIKQDYNSQELYRIKGKGEKILGFEDNQGMIDFIFLIDGYNQLNLKDKFPPFRINELMNVKYTTALDTITKSIYFEYNENHLPRAWMSYYPVVESSLERVAEILKDTTFEIETKVIVDQEPEVSIDTNLWESFIDTVECQVAIKFYEINEITLSVQTSENGILVLSEVYYPNWKVFVDGVEKTMLRCDYSLRGVAIEKGNHTVVFKYIDKDFQLGAIITLFAFAIVVGGFIKSRK